MKERGFLVTVEELELDPRKLETKMRNLANISIWKKHYHNKRVTNGYQIKPWRDKIEQIEKEIKQARKDAIVKRKELERQKEKERKELESYSKFHERLVQFHHALLDKRERLKDRKITPDTPEYETFIAVAARSFGNDIHDFPEVKLGLMTHSCYTTKLANPQFKTTAEHFWPRSVVGGRDLLEQSIMMGEKFSIRHTIRTLYQLCQTIESLDSENRELMKHQKADTFVDPQVSYKAAGIRLVRVKEFSIPNNWERAFSQYEIDFIPPYEFSDVMTTDNFEEPVVNSNDLGDNSREVDDESSC